MKPSARIYTCLGFLAPLALLALQSGCRSPEDGRGRTGDPGGDAHNYVSRPIHVPSKIDATKNAMRGTR